MESERFDRLAKSLFLEVSRRAAVTGVAGGAAALVLTGAWRDLEDNLAKAAKKGKRKRTFCHCGSGDPRECKTLRKKKKAVARHLRQHCDYKGPCRSSVVNPCDPSSECLGIIALQADAVLEDGELTLTTEGSNGFGAAGFGVPANKTFAEIESISTDFDFTTGDCGAGTPRFCVRFEGRDDCACAQIQTDLCDEPSELEGNSGNLIGNNTSGTWFRICADGPNINTYEDALEEYGDEVIRSIFVVADVSNGAQTVTLVPCISFA